MGAVILIPWRSNGDPLRERNLQAVLEWYKPLGLPVVFGDTDHQPFNRGAARNAAARAAGDWDVALIADADTIAMHSVVLEALELARVNGQLIIPHDDFYRMNRRGTQTFLGNPNYYRDNPKKVLNLTGWPRIDKSMMPSGALVISKASFEAMGMYEEGFVGWGYEDSAFLLDAAATIGVTRLSGMLWHLYHRPDYGTMADRRANEELLRQAGGSRRRSHALQSPPDLLVL